MMQYILDNNDRLEIEKRACYKRNHYVIKFQNYYIVMYK